ncbi:Gfo/Idh/MocA family protein [Ilumatobacter sp.]|uniref:Gfo/Idh/MocA family protein n=1 Tax=Ilumatobacter sp. TaxID=1967498 RepID=UPI003AF425B6
MNTRRRLGIGVIGFGWMGQAHSRSAARISSLFPDRTFDAELIVCGDTVPERQIEAVEGFGFREATSDWRKVIEHPDVDVVYVTAPNMMHEELAIAAAEAGKAVFCEKPVGGKPDQTVRVDAAARRAGVITGVGYNYRWAPLVQHARHLIESGRLGEITNYRGRFFSMYGADPMGLLSWRFSIDEAGYGVSSDILSHAVDLAAMLVGPVTSVSGTMETFIRERPMPKAGGTHYDRGSPDDPTGPVTNEDYAAAMVRFENGARGTFESSRAIIGPESQMAFDVYGTEGALRWNLETMNELDVFIVDESGTAPRGYTKVYAGERYPYHGNFVPGDANSIGYEDLKVIENYEFLSAVARGEQHQPGFAEAVDYVSFQDAWVRSCESGSWTDVVSLREDI